MIGHDPNDGRRQRRITSHARIVTACRELMSEGTFRPIGQRIAEAAGSAARCGRRGMTKACLLAAFAGWMLAWATDARSAMQERPAQTFVRLKGWMVLECPARQEGPSEECIVHGEPQDSKTACDIERARTAGAANGTRLECEYVDQLVEVR